MDNKLKALCGTFGSVFSLSGLTMTSEEVANIVSIICAVLGALWTITFTGIIPLIKWLKKAKEDGKITKEELDEAKQIIKDTTEQVNSIKEERKEESK